MNNEKQPPGLARFILQKTARKDIRYSALGDFEEIFYDIAAEKGIMQAKLWYWSQVFKSLPSFAFESFQWSIIMLASHIKIAFRNMRRQKLDTFLNLCGLSFGIACSILILFHISQELSYDKFFPKAERIFRISGHMPEGNTTRNWAATDPVIAEHIKDYVPEIERICRMFYIPSIVMSFQPDAGPVRRFKEKSGFFTDQPALDIFDFEFTAGGPENALSEVNTIILTETTALKYFPNEDPIGRHLSIGGGSEAELVKVTGVIKDVPENSHTQFNFLLSYPTFVEFLREAGKEDMTRARGWAALYNYVLLYDKNLKNAADEKMPEFCKEHFAGSGIPDEQASEIYKLQPMLDIHLYSHLEQEIKPGSDITYVLIFLAIAVFIMIIAGVNFINLAAAQALKRMKETGVRKMLGARRSQLIKQIIGESFLMIFSAALLSVFLIKGFLPVYNGIVEKNYFFTDIFILRNTIIFAGIIMVFGFLSSLYPALYVSGFNPINAVKGVCSPVSSASKIRKSLVIFQFVISVFMIFSTIIIFQQVQYFKTRKLGFNKENVLCVQLNNDLQTLAVKNPQMLKNELTGSPDVLSASIVSNIPGDRLSVEHLHVQGAPDADERGQFRFIRADKDYLKTLNLQLIEGRDFNEVSPVRSSFIISRKAAEALGIDSPLGRTGRTVFGQTGEIVGIVENFNFASLHNMVEPLAIEYFPSDNPMKQMLTNHLLVRISGRNTAQTISYIEEKITKAAPASLFTYSFLDKNLDNLYQAENRMNMMFQAFAVFALFISCLGLFGLSSYSAQLRIKEIGVRKALGASVSSILKLLSGKYLVWVLTANLIALPLGWMFMTDWLSNFAYRIQINGKAFILTMLISILIAMLTVVYQVLKAAGSNPVDSLRYE